jgi:hypothetical protein
VLQNNFHCLGLVIIGEDSFGVNRVKTPANGNTKCRVQNGNKVVS